MLVNLLSNIVTALLTTSTTSAHAQLPSIIVYGSQVGMLAGILLVRRHLKYVWFTKLTKFWGEVKNGPSLGISKNKKAFSFRGASTRALPLDPAGGSAPRPPNVPPAPNLPLHHWPWRLVSYPTAVRHDCIGKCIAWHVALNSKRQTPRTVTLWTGNVGARFQPHSYLRLTLRLSNKEVICIVICLSLPLSLPPSVCVCVRAYVSNNNSITTTVFHIKYHI